MALFTLSDARKPLAQASAPMGQPYGDAAIVVEALKELLRSHLRNDSQYVRRRMSM